MNTADDYELDAWRSRNPNISRGIDLALARGLPARQILDSLVAHYGHLDEFRRAINYPPLSRSSCP
jgi:hypothetical protein